jgi:serine/threonine-protein kinase HipA
MLRRFDRHGTQDGFLRSRMVSGLTLMRTEDTHQSREAWSYLTLADEIRRISPDRKQDLPELFRRICFNALISNTDDHPRNHAVIAKDEHWKLSPAYDLTPKPHISVERRDLALSFGDWGRYANRYNLLSQCGRFLLSPDEAERIIDDMAEQVRTTWYATARNAGVSERDCEAIRGAFAYEGFDLIPEARQSMTPGP